MEQFPKLIQIFCDSYGILAVELTKLENCYDTYINDNSTNQSDESIGMIQNYQKIIIISPNDFHMSVVIPKFYYNLFFNIIGKVRNELNETITGLENLETDVTTSVNNLANYPTDGQGVKGMYLFVTNYMYYCLLIKFMFFLRSFSS